MTQEEKAKRYDEAISQLKGLLDSIHEEKCDIIEEDIVRIFPELAESEDERMRNAAINACKYMVDNFENSTKQYEEAIAWLEKQERKPAAWSAEDEKMKKVLVKILSKKAVRDSLLSERIEISQALEWIQKQGESYTKRDVDDAYVEGIAFAKNELEKQEQKPDWSYEDEANLNNIIWLCNNCINGSETTWIPSQATKVKHLIETIKERGLAQQKPAWSEEDEEHLLDVNAAVDDYFGEDYAEELRDWLKSLKHKVQPQPKQEWSEEDKYMIDNLIRIFERNPDGYYKAIRKDMSSDNIPIIYASGIIDWLKSLKK